MDKGTIVIKTGFKALADSLIKRLMVLIIILLICLAGYKLKNFTADKFNITDSIFKADPLGIVSMVLIYIVLAILLLLLIISLFKFLAVFYELKRVTVIDYAKERITIQSYDFPFEREIEEKRFNTIVGVDILQKSIDRLTNSGTMYIEYLVLSKNDSKLRGIEIPNVLNPENIKKRLLET